MQVRPRGAAPPSSRFICHSRQIYRGFSKGPRHTEARAVFTNRTTGGRTCDADTRQSGKIQRTVRLRPSQTDTNTPHALETLRGQNGKMSRRGWHRERERRREAEREEDGAGPLWRFFWYTNMPWPENNKANDISIQNVHSGREPMCPPRRMLVAGLAHCLARVGLSEEQGGSESREARITPSEVDKVHRWPIYAAMRCRAFLGPGKCTAAAYRPPKRFEELFNNFAVIIQKNKVVSWTFMRPFGVGGLARTTGESI